MEEDQNQSLDAFATLVTEIFDLGSEMYPWQSSAPVQFMETPGQPTVFAEESSQPLPQVGISNQPSAPDGFPQVQSESPQVIWFFGSKRPSEPNEDKKRGWEKKLAEIAEHARSLAQDMGAESVSITAGVPWGISVSVSFSTKSS